jgi:hypothetical protein
MASRQKPNWKLLDPLVLVLEKEGWSHSQIAEDWGISLATLEGHLNREGESMPTPLREIDWQRFDELKAQGLPMLRISKEMEIPEATLRQRAQRRDKAHRSTPTAHQDTPEAHPSTPDEPELWTVHQRTPKHTEILPAEQYTQEHLSTPDADPTEVHPGTLEGHQEVMEDISQSVPDAPHIGTEGPYQSTPEHPSTPAVHPEMSLIHSGVPARQDHLISTPMVHPGTPSEEDWMLWTTMKGRWVEVEKMLADWKTRHSLLSTPSGTPRNTIKKTYVVDSVHVAWIDQYAREHGIDIKDVLFMAIEAFIRARSGQEI